MRLKRLDIIGFKSFMDKTVLQFHPGVTGVVGPNGCGKSNIVDAIRWVLGEQSPKHLRGGSMSDVIFNGSQTRPPMGMAEVTLTFFNDQPEEIPARYREYPEIAVTRRLFRTGESEYLINKIPCRLLDITEVFLGTGVGTKAYSIIEQGRIGLIVSAKPDDRRALIEEAAGITRYKVKKRAAERKMEHTRNNLLRVGDLTSELKKRLDSLERQARKAARYKELKSELRDIELHRGAHRWLEITAFRSALEGRLAKTERALADEENEIGTLEGAQRTRREQLFAEEARLGSLQEEAAACEGQSKVHEERAVGALREKESLDLRTREASEDIAELTERVAATRTEESELEESLGELQRVLDSDRTDLELRATDLEEMTDSARALTERIELERTADVEAVRVLTRGKSHLAALEKQRLELEQRDGRGADERAHIKQQIDSRQRGHADLTSTLHQTRQLHLAIEEKKESGHADLGQTRETLAALGARLAGLRDDLSDRRSRLNSLIEIQKNFEGYAQGVRSVMLHRDEIDGVQASDVEGLLVDVIRATPQCEVAIEAVLGEKLQFVLVRSRQTGVDLVRYLEDGARGRGSFVPMDTLRSSGADKASDLAGRPGVVSTGLDAVTVEPEHTEVLRHLLGNVLIVDSLETAFSLWSEADARVTFVTLDGIVLSAEGIISGGEVEDAGAHLLELRREIEELTHTVREMEQTVSTEGVTRDRLEQRTSALEAGLRDLSTDSHAEQINIVSHEKELHHLTDQLMGHTDRLTTLTAEHEQHRADLAGIREETGRTRSGMDQAEKDQAEREVTLKQLQSEIRLTNDRLDSTHSELTGLRVKAAGDAERRDASAKTLARLQHARGEFEARIRHLTDTVEGSGSAFEDLLQRHEHDLAEATRLHERAQTLRTQLARDRESVAAATETARKDDERLDAMRLTREETSTQRSDLALQDREMEIELAHLGENVLERHASTIDEAVAEFHLEAPPTEQHLERLEILRRKVERMGEVNLTAITQFEEISERYEFLSTQKADLEESLLKLEQAIRKIDRTSKRRFMETFEAVSSRFETIFPRLFKGGKAGLSLTDPSNPLESGVEIFAQPPGKKLQTVSLLSGGEKALTAISLLFAMFLVRPTPFCLLDEVDAPLDDTNVMRYNQIVLEMSAQSQFILITHNKQTMEITDTLYGVTMEEPGISKLVSVALTAEGSDRAGAVEAA